MFSTLPALCIAGGSTDTTYKSISNNVGSGKQGREGLSVAGGLRLEARAALKLANSHNPQAIMTLASLRIPHLDCIPQPDISIPPSVGRGMGISMGAVHALLVEANDICFGSTLLEQTKYADQLLEWVSIVFPAEIPSFKDNSSSASGSGSGSSSSSSSSSSSGVVSGTAADWQAVFELGLLIVSWLPKLCLSLEIHDPQESLKLREKVCILYTVVLVVLYTVNYTL